jgi:hypothetical protein
MDVPVADRLAASNALNPLKTGDGFVVDQRVGHPQFAKTVENLIDVQIHRR